MKLSELPTGGKAIIINVAGHGAFRKRIIEMGFVKGKTVTAIRNAPLNDPIEYKILDYYVSLRREEANLIDISTDLEADRHRGTATNPASDIEHDDVHRQNNNKRISVALVGNPNCGKTTLFNTICGANEHTGNYSGVTIGAKSAAINHNGYTINVVDLPGTYSVSAYSPEETFVRNQILDSEPDIVLNVLDSSNIERNLYLTTQLIDMGVRTVVALNIFDELEQSGSKLNYKLLGQMLGIPMVPTVGSKNRGIKELLDTIVSVYEGTEKYARNIRINYGNVVEDAITAIEKILSESSALSNNIIYRYAAIKALEGDMAFVRSHIIVANADELCNAIAKRVARATDTLQTDTETLLTDTRYGFISGALEETYVGVSKNDNSKSRSQQIDRVLTNRFWGIPLFVFFIWLMFECTFNLGQYPMDWIDAGVGFVGDIIQKWMPEGPLKELITDGIIRGVGGVIVFLPNILILFLFISFMEDTGYMARAAFIMDKMMHKMGLHGKSFIPLVMGFGCNVPAIMATRTIEDRNNRMLTMLINPLMSCSARLPLYLLFCGAFFPENAGTVLFCIYFTGILIAVVVSRIFKRFIFKGEELPFVMELPPYRLPTLRSTIVNMWSKASQYLSKMGGPILVASILIWFLGYFPRHDADATASASQYTQQDTIADSQTQQENSYIGRIGKFIEPAIAPLGFDWKMGVSLLSGIAAKEIIVSTIGVLYTQEGDSDVASLSNNLRNEVRNGKPVFNNANVLAFMTFVLLYFPCIASIAAIRNESSQWRGLHSQKRHHRLRHKSWHWAIFTIVYTTTLAWCVSWVVYHVALLFV